MTLRRLKQQSLPFNSLKSRRGVGSVRELKAHRRVSTHEGDKRMYRIWYWATIDRESDGGSSQQSQPWRPRSLRLLGQGRVAHVTDLAREQCTDGGGDSTVGAAAAALQQMPSYLHSKEIGRTIIPVEVDRQAAGAAPPYHVAP